MTPSLKDVKYTVSKTVSTGFEVAATDNLRAQQPASLTFIITADPHSISHCQYHRPTQRCTSSGPQTHTTLHITSTTDLHVSHCQYHRPTWCFTSSVPQTHTMFHIISTTDPHDASHCQYHGPTWCFTLSVPRTHMMLHIVSTTDPHDASHCQYHKPTWHFTSSVPQTHMMFHISIKTSKTRTQCKQSKKNRCAYFTHPALLFQCSTDCGVHLWTTP